MSRLPDPSWKSGPTYPEPTSDEHAIDLHGKPTGMDIDGVGVDEAKHIDGEPLLAVREVYRCPRDGCEAYYRRHHLYRLEDVDMDAIVAGDAYGCRPAYPAEFLASRAVVVDHDGEHPYIGFGDRDVYVDYVGPCHTIEEDGGASGPCYGNVEPNPDIDSYRYEEL